MIEIGVILILAGLLLWKEYSSRKERENMLDIIISKGNPEEVSKMRLAKKTKFEPVKTEEPDLMAIDDLDVDSKEFKNILKQNG